MCEQITHPLVESEYVMDDHSQIPIDDDHLCRDTAYPWVQMGHYSVSIHQGTISSKLMALPTHFYQK